jgi:predicted nucleic acid binding AN1-type Zn finger protein
MTDTKADEEQQLQEAIKLSLQESGEKLVTTPVKKNKNPCALDGCGKRLTMSNSIDCKCGKTFCIAHRYPHDHRCTFDHSKQFRGKLENQMVKLDKEKMTERV